MKRTILLVDNEPIRIKKINKVIQETLDYYTLHQVKTLDQAYKVLLEYTIDIFIVNVVLSAADATDTEGLRFIARVREIPRYTLTPVIMISSLQDPQLFAFEELNCLGYISKLFAEERLKKLLIKASYYETKRTAEKLLIFRRNRIIYPVLIRDIVYMVRENGITMVHMADGSVMDVPYISYTKILQNADDSALFLCNRGTIVNRDYVYAVDATNEYVILKDNRGMLNIGTAYRKKVMREFSNQYGMFCARTRTKRW